MDKLVETLSRVQSDIDRVRERNAVLTKSIEIISNSMKKILDEIVEVVEQMKTR